MSGILHHILYGLRDLVPFGRIVVFLVLVAPLGCSVPDHELTTYSATVERVVERQGDFYSPVKGHKPLYCLYLRLNGSNQSERKEPLRVLVLDLYVWENYGQKGDTVEFRYPGDLRRIDEVDFDSLFKYRVVEKGG